MSHEAMSGWVDRDDDDDDDEDVTLLSQLVGKLPAQYILDPHSKASKLQESPVEQNENEVPYEYLSVRHPEPGNLDETLELGDNRVPSNLRNVVINFKDDFRGNTADKFIFKMFDGIQRNREDSLSPKEVIENMADSLKSQVKTYHQQIALVQSATDAVNTLTKTGEEMEPTLSQDDGPGQVLEITTKPKGSHAKNQKTDDRIMDENDIAKYKMKQTVDELKKQGLLPKLNQVPVCVIPECTKKATCECTICGKLLYCSSKHLKIHSQSHASNCKKYRLSPGNGKCVMAARECKTGDTILVDVPVAAFPHNRNNSQDHRFPTNYCTKCCSNLDCATELCPGQCKLRVCSNKEQCVPPKYGATSHSESECGAISCHYIRQKWLDLRTTDSIIGLTRTVLQKRNNDVNLKKLLLKMSSLLSQKPNTNKFNAKLEFFRKYLDISDKVIADEDLKRLDAAFTRFGRNTGLDVFIPAQYDFNNKRDIRGFYNEASYVLHSCIPNSAVICDPNSRLYVQAYKCLKKGDRVTICYDNRCVFWPIWRRRNYLKSDYDFSCKCTRCTSISDLETYFSVFPCSSDSCNENNYIVPEDPLVGCSNWTCKSCGVTDIPFQRVEHIIMRLENEIEQVSGNPIALWEKITELITEKYLHWNNFIVFNSCVKLFNMLWKQLNEQHPTTTRWYYKDEGRIVPAADTLLDLTHKFMPYGYQAEHCLALRIGGVVKMHDLAEKIKDEKMEDSDVEEFIHATYFRSEVFVKKPLYEIIPLDMTESEHESLQLFEFKALCKVYEVLAPSSYGTYEEWDSKTPYLLKFITFMIGKNPTLRARIKFDQYQTNSVM